MKEDGGQEDKKNIMSNDGDDDEEINNLNEDELCLCSGLRNNVNDGNNEYNHIKQGGIVNKQG